MNLEERIPVSRPFWLMLKNREQECSDLVLALQRLSAAHPKVIRWKTQLAAARNDLTAVCRLINGYREAANDEALKEWIGNHLPFLPEATIEWATQWMEGTP